MIVASAAGHGDIHNKTNLQEEEEGEPMPSVHCPQPGLVADLQSSRQGQIQKFECGLALQGL